MSAWKRRPLSLPLANAPASLNSHASASPPPTFLGRRRKNMRCSIRRHRRLLGRRGNRWRRVCKCDGDCAAPCAQCALHAVCSLADDQHSLGERRADHARCAQRRLVLEDRRAAPVPHYGLVGDDDGRAGRNGVVEFLCELGIEADARGDVLGISTTAFAGDVHPALRGAARRQPARSSASPAYARAVFPSRVRRRAGRGRRRRGLSEFIRWGRCAIRAGVHRWGA